MQRDDAATDIQSFAPNLQRRHTHARLLASLRDSRHFERLGAARHSCPRAALEGARLLAVHPRFHRLRGCASVLCHLSSFDWPGTTVRLVPSAATPSVVPDAPSRLDHGAAERNGRGDAQDLRVAERPRILQEALDAVFFELLRRQLLHLRQPA